MAKRGDSSQKTHGTQKTHSTQKTKSTLKTDSMSIDELFGNKYVAALLVCILVICLIVIYWVFSSKDLHEREGDRLMTESRFEDALTSYHRSLKSYTFGKENKARITLKIASALEATGDKERAIDFLYSIMKDFPGTKVSPKAENRLRKLFDSLRHEIYQLPPSSSEIGKYRAKYHQQYLKIVAIIENNRSGVPGKLVQAYENYKESYQIYKRKLSKAYFKAVKEENEKRTALKEKVE